MSSRLHATLLGVVLIIGFVADAIAQATRVSAPVDACYQQKKLAGEMSNSE